MSRPRKNQHARGISCFLKDTAPHMQSSISAHQRIQTNSPLKKLRCNANLTQEKLAIKIGVAVSSIRRWERGETETTMTLSQTKKFCRAINHLRSLSFRKILMTYLILCCPKSNVTRDRDLIYPSRSLLRAI